MEEVSDTVMLLQEHTRVCSRDQAAGYSLCCSSPRQDKAGEPFPTSGSIWCLFLVMSLRMGR